jgi:hypothetical protein
MADTEQPESVGAMLARIRWAKTGKAERARVARMLVAARRAKRGTVAAKSRPRKPRKS